MRCLDSITNSVDMNLCKLWEIMEDREVWHATIHGVSSSIIQFLTEQQQFFSHKKKKKKIATCNNMNRSGGHYA